MNSSNDEIYILRSLQAMDEFLATIKNNYIQNIPVKNKTWIFW